MKIAMDEQWDRISAENAFFGVLSRQGYEDAEKVDVEQFWKTGREDVDAFMKILGFDNPRSLRMLEIGCGLGRMTHHFSHYFEHVQALDVSPAMLQRAQTYWGHLENVSWVRGSGDNLSTIADTSVDFVFSFWVLQHIPDPNTVLHYVRETARVLKPDGVALLQFRVMPPHSRLTALKYAIFAYCPTPITKRLIGAWDALNRNTGVRAKFAREYEAWRGCALGASTIAATATAERLQIVATDRLGRQSPGTESRYFIFRKPGD